jgi:SAM-dependent methyltransferase
VTQYATDANLAARQRLWQTSPRDVQFDLFAWVLDMADGDDVLDVGCGNGSYLARRPSAIGMDLSPGMLSSARRRATSPLVCGDAQRLPFATASFDAVLAPHMLYHVPDRKLAAKELRRVLRPGGVCIAVTNGSHTHAALVEIVEEAVGTGWRWARLVDNAFNMENGAAQLATAFDSVETLWAPDVTFSVVDADALADYVASVADAYEDDAAVEWSDVVERCRERAREIIERDGSLPITARLGAFVCR